MLSLRSALAALLVAGAAAGAGTSLQEDEPRARPDVPPCTGAAALDLGCQQRRFAAIVRGEGVDRAFAQLKRAYAREGFVRAACHPIVHTIGHAAVARHGRDLPGLYARGDPFCSAGYFHGVTEQLIVELGRDRFVARADDICRDLGGHPRHSIYHRNCAHGIGHGFLLVREGDLPAALRTCDRLADRWEQRSCYGGVFMQNVMGLERSRYLRPRDPLYPCGDLADRHRAMCYEKQTGYALYARNGDVAAVFGLCARVDRRFRAPCAQGLGTSVAVHHLKQVHVDRDLRRLTARACDLAQRLSARAGCVRGAVRALINYDHDTARAVALCAAVAPGLRAGCRASVAAKRTYPE